MAGALAAQRLSPEDVVRCSGRLGLPDYVQVQPGPCCISILDPGPPFSRKYGA